MRNSKSLSALVFLALAASVSAQSVHSLPSQVEAHAALSPAAAQVTITKTPDPSAKRAKIEEMIRLTRADQMLDQMSSQMSAQMKTTIEQQDATRDMTPQQLKLTSEFQANVQKIITDSMSWERLKPVIITVYSDTYTEEEIDGIVAFYRSPAGQAVINKMPQVMASTMGLVKTQMSELQPRLEQAMREYTDAMKQSGSSDPAGGTSR